MQQTAAREGLTPQGLADRTAAQFEAMGDLLNARADDIVRTTSQRHKESVTAIWKRMEEKGDIYLSKYSGWYSVRDEAYYGEDEIEEREGRRFSIKTGTLVEWVEEESYFFKLSAYGEKLLNYYRDNPDFIVPEQYRNEIVSFVERGLLDLSMSRTTFDWGIPVPGNPKHVMYVWVDALTNYITATGFPDREWSEVTFLAGIGPCHRQGHHALSRHLLACLSDVGGFAGSKADRGAWLPVQQGREDVKVHGQHRIAL